MGKYLHGIPSWYHGDTSQFKYQNKEETVGGRNVESLNPIEKSILSGPSVSNFVNSGNFQNFDSDKKNVVIPQPSVKNYLGNINSEIAKNNIGSPSISDAVKNIGMPQLQTYNSHIHPVRNDEQMPPTTNYNIPLKNTYNSHIKSVPDSDYGKLSSINGTGKNDSTIPNTTVQHGTIEEWKPTAIQKLKDALSNIGNDIKSGLYGLAKGVGSDSLIRLEDTIYKNSLKKQGYGANIKNEGDINYSPNEKLNSFIGRRTDTPISKPETVSNVLGNILGNVVKMTGISTGANAATEGVSNPIANKIISRTLTGMGLGAEETYGQNKSAVKDYITNMARETAFMNAGGTASDLAEKYGLKAINSAPNAIKNSIGADLALKGVKGAAFGAAGTAATLPTYDKKSRPSNEDIVKNALSGALFEIIPGVIDTFKTNKENAQIVDGFKNIFKNKMVRDYNVAQYSTLSGDIPKANSTYDNILSYIDDADKAFTDLRFVGQTDKVKNMHDALSYCKNFISYQKSELTPKPEITDNIINPSNAENNVPHADNMTVVPTTANLAGYGKVNVMSVDKNNIIVKDSTGETKKFTKQAFDTLNLDGTKYNVTDNKNGNITLSDNNGNLVNMPENDYNKISSSQKSNSTVSANTAQNIPNEPIASNNTQSNANAPMNVSSAPNGLNKGLNSNININPSPKTQNIPQTNLNIQKSMTAPVANVNANIGQNSVSNSNINITPTLEDAKSSVKTLSTNNIGVDPARFQFKSNTDSKTGTSNLLKNVTKWNNDLSGIITVWQDKNGKDWVVNGHHRLELAKRLGIKNIDAKVLYEKDGISANDAREIGAKINLAEGRGTATDAAKVFKGGNYTIQDLKDSGLSLSEGVIKNGYNIAQLNGRLFSKVVNTELPENEGAMIGQAFPHDNGGKNDNLQNTLYDYIQGEGGVGKTDLQQAINMLKNSDSMEIKNISNQTSMFDNGNTVIFGNNFKAKKDIIKGVIRKLSMEKNLFKNLANTQKANIAEKAGNKLNSENNLKNKQISERAIEFVNSDAWKKGTQIGNVLNKYANNMLAGGETKKNTDGAFNEIKNLIATGDFLKENKGNDNQINGQQNLFGEVEKNNEEQRQTEISTSDNSGAKATTTGQTGEKEAAIANTEGAKQPEQPTAKQPEQIKKGKVSKDEHPVETKAKEPENTNDSLLKAGEKETVETYRNKDGSFDDKVIEASERKDHQLFLSYAEPTYPNGNKYGKTNKAVFTINCGFIVNRGRKIKVVGNIEDVIEKFKSVKSVGSETYQVYPLIKHHDFTWDKQNKMWVNKKYKEGQPDETDNKKTAIKPEDNKSIEVNSQTTNKDKKIYDVGDKFELNGRKYEIKRINSDSVRALDLTGLYPITRVFSIGEFNQSVGDIKVPTARSNSNNVTSKNSESQLIADKLIEKIEKKKAFTSNELFSIANVAYKGTQAQGKYTSKDAYDAMELAVNEYLLKQNEMNLATRNTAEVKENITGLQNLLRLLPTQTKRTEEQMSYQQFSTPPSIAYLVSYLANIDKNDTVLEPSAGTGSLAVFAKVDGAKEIAVNELSKRRLEILKNLGFDKYFNENAEQIDNILPDDVKPTVVIMNPPFSATAGRMADINSTKNAEKHIEQALNRLEDGGRLVAIVGQGMAEDRPTFKDFWKDIKSKYNVRANISLGKSDFTKYGTGFGTQIFVIDKDGSTTEPTITGEFSNLQSVVDKLEGVSNDRKHLQPNRQIQQIPAEPNSKAISKESTPNSGSVSNIQLPTNELGSAETRNTNKRIAGREKADERPDTRHNVPARAKSANGIAEPNTAAMVNESSNTNTSSRISSGETQDSTNRYGHTLNVEKLTDEEIKKNNTAKDTNEDSVYSAYAPQKLKIEGAKKHPGELVESAAMGAVEPPDPIYKPILSDDVIKNGKLSLAQLESIVYAGQAHEKRLPNGNRKGFFIGDGTGVGKGREIAGIIMDNFNHGRKKAIWVSKNDPLFADAQRDWDSIGGNKDSVLGFGKVKPNAQIQAKDGIMFVTYGRLSRNMEISGQKNSNKQSAISQLVNWLGKNYDGVIVFDEAHHMANNVSMKAKRGTRKPSIRALAGIELQKQLPNARIVYASATGATEVANLGYAERLGLWGVGTPFANKEDFINKISQGGLAAMELVSRDMKSMGLYLSRSLSYSNVKYRRLEHKLSPEQTEIYDKMAYGWQKVLQNINKALEATEQKSNGRAKANAVGQFWSAQQRFFNQILTSMQMPSVIEDIKKQLSDGNAVVLQIVNTNEATQNRQLAKLKKEEGSLDNLDLTPRELLLQYLDKSFPIDQFEKYVDDNGNEQSRLVTDSEGKPVINKQALQMKNKLMQELGSLKVPEGPLEILLNTFGAQNVAEVTGRTRRIVKDKNGNAKEEKLTKNSVAADVQSFMDDKKKILIFSDAGGTGKSYHADLTVKNQRHRVHYLLQAGWKADAAVQGFGRTHRTNEASAPTYVLVTTNLKGQMRFISSIARRLDQLGALTKGQRQTGGQGLFSEKDNLESDMAKDALYRFYKALSKNLYDDLDKDEVLEKMGLKDKLLDKYGRLNECGDARDVTKFLNRLLCLESNLQNKVFDRFSGTLDDMVESAIANGTLETGLENFKADKVSIDEEKTIRKDKDTGAETKYVQVKASNKNKILQFKDVPIKNDDFIGFCYNPKSKNIKALFKGTQRTLSDGNVIDTYTMLGQISHKINKITIPDFEKSNWEKINNGQAEKLWNEAILKVPEYNTEKLHLITGTLLPIWDRLPQETARIMRVIADDGKTYLGRFISEDSIDEVLRSLGAERNKEPIDISKVANSILNDNARATLTNGWKLERSKVSGDYRIELIGNELYKYSDELKKDGVFLESISYTTRYFIPTDKATDVMKKLTEYRPITNISVQKKSTVDAYVGTVVKQPIRINNNINNKPLPRKQIIDNLIKEIDVPARVGKYRKRASGIYKEHDEVIRTKLAEDIPILSHEIGHHLDKLYSLSSAVKANKTYENELMNLGKGQASVQKLDKAGQIKEGIAEFTRKYLTGEDTNAPEFEKFFEKVIDKKILKAMKAFQEQYGVYQNSSAEDRILSQISFSEKHSVKDKIKKVFDFNKLYAQWIDELRPLESLTNQGTVKGINDNPYLMATLFRGWAGKAETAIKYGVIDYSSGKPVKIADGLENILKPVSKDIKSFIAYSVAKRAIEKEGQHIHTGIGTSDAEDVYDKYKDNEIFNTALDKLQQYQDAILKRLVDGGVLSEKSYNAIKEMNRDYVPFYRVFDQEGYSSKAMGKSFANLGKPIKRMKGSNRTIVNPIESIVKNTFYFTNIAERNKVGLSLVKFSRENEGLGKFIERVAPNMKATNFELKEIKKTLDEAGTQLDDEHLSMVGTIFRPIMRGNPKDCTVTIYEKGKPELYQLAPDIYKAVMSTDTELLNGALKLLTYPARLLRAGAVVYNTEFAGRNPIKDALDAATYSKYNFIPIFDTVKGLFHVLKKDDLYYEWLNSGAAQSQMVSLDRDYLSKNLNKILSEGEPLKLFLNFIKNPLEPLRELSELTEEATRVGMYLKGIKKEGNTEEGSQYSALNSRSGTLDFSRSGYSGKTANKFIAFFNAVLQGQDKLLRTFMNKNTRYKSLFKALLYITMPSMILWYLYHDNDKIKHLPSWRKNLYWNIPTEKRIVSIPKPFELGILFGSLPERILDYIESKNAGNGEEGKKNIEDWFKSLAENITPDLLPTAIKPIIEIWANRSFFRGTKIVNDTYQKMPNYMQYSSYTSKLAKEIGKFTSKINGEGLSPLMIDNTIQGYLGGAGTSAVQYIDKMLPGKEPEKPSSTLEKIPFVKGFVSEPYSQSTSVDEYYDSKEKVDEEYSTASKQYKADHPEMTDKAWNYLIRKDIMPTEELYKLHIEKKQYTEMDKKLKSIKDSQDQIIKSMSLTSNQKQEQINILNEQKSKLLDTFNRSMREYNKK